MTAEEASASTLRESEAHRAELEETRRQHQADLEEARRQHEVELEETQRQHRTELEEAQRQHQAEVAMLRGERDAERRTVAELVVKKDRDLSMALAGIRGMKVR